MTRETQNGATRGSADRPHPPPRPVSLAARAREAESNNNTLAAMPAANVRAAPIARAPRAPSSSPARGGQVGHAYGAAHGGLRLRDVRRKAVHSHGRAGLVDGQMRASGPRGRCGGRGRWNSRRALEKALEICLGNRKSRDTLLETDFCGDSLEVSLVSLHIAQRSPAGPCGNCYTVLASNMRGHQRSMGRQTALKPQAGTARSATATQHSSPQTQPQAQPLWLSPAPACGGTTLRKPRVQRTAPAAPCSP